MRSVMDLLTRIATEPKCETKGESHVSAVEKIWFVAHDDGMLVIILGRGDAESVWATVTVGVVLSLLVAFVVLMMFLVR